MNLLGKLMGSGVKEAAEGITTFAQGVKTLITGKLPPTEEAGIMEKITELANQAEKIAADDRSSARQREIATGDKTTRNLAYAALCGFFAVLGVQFWIAFNGRTIDAGIQRTIDITTGVLFAWVLAVKDYYFGSSSGSAKKTDTIDRMIRR